MEVPTSAFGLEPGICKEFQTYRLVLKAVLESPTGAHPAVQETMVFTTKQAVDVTLTRYSMVYTVNPAAITHAVGNAPH